MSKSKGKGSKVYRIKYDRSEVGMVLICDCGFRSGPYRDRYKALMSAADHVTGKPDHIKNVATMIKRMNLGGAK